MTYTLELAAILLSLLLLGTGSLLVYYDYEFYKNGQIVETEFKDTWSKRKCDSDGCKTYYYVRFIYQNPERGARAKQNYQVNHKSIWQSIQREPDSVEVEAAKIKMPIIVNYIAGKMGMEALPQSEWNVRIKGDDWHFFYIGIFIFLLGFMLFIRTFFVFIKHIADILFPDKEVV